MAPSSLDTNAAYQRFVQKLANARRNYRLETRPFKKPLMRGESPRDAVQPIIERDQPECYPPYV